MPIEESYEGELLFLENSLEIDILEGNLLNEVEHMNAFYEEDNESPENNGLIEKVASAITKMLMAIRNMLERFIRTLTGIGKDHATLDDYKETEAGWVEWNARYAQSCREIDEYMRSCRPCISMISNITNCDIEKVEKYCDTLNVIVEKADWEKYAKKAMRKEYSKKQWKKYADDATEWNNRLLKATNELKSGKREIKDRKRRIRALERMTSNHAKFTSKLFGFVSKN